MGLQSRALFGLFLLQTLSLCSYTRSDRSDDGSAYDRIETRGNLTFGCSPFGPCTLCSYAEKGDDETYHCSSTGYRQTYRCVDLGADNKPAFHQMNSMRGLYESSGALQNWAGRKVIEEESSSKHGGHQILYIYSSCTPTEKDGELSVLAFEGIILGLFALSAPVIYHRKRRHFSVSGMSRIPTSARF